MPEAMKFTIESTHTIKDLKDAFQQHFPFLKLEFYGIAHHDHEGSPRVAQIGDQKTFGELKTDFQTGEIYIDDAMTVAQLEESFQRQFGLNAQVFRKSGSQWIQTIVTDDWTIHEQNETAREYES